MEKKIYMRTGEMMKITQDKIDRLADVLWWIMGWVKNDSAADFDGNHIQALIDIKVSLQEEINEG